MVFARILGFVGSDTGDLFFGWELADQVRQDRCDADVATCDLDGPNLQRLFIGPEMDLAPDAPFRPTMFACVPLAVALDLDLRAIDQKAQPVLGTSKPEVPTITSRRLAIYAWNRNGRSDSRQEVGFRTTPRTNDTVPLQVS